MKPLSLCWMLLTAATLLARPALSQDTGSRPQQDTVQLQKLDAVLAFIRQRNARDYAITTPNGIDDGKYVAIGGIQQWITIRGEDRGNPVLLFLHGGPGDVTNPWAYAAFARGCDTSPSCSGSQVAEVS